MTVFPKRGAIALGLTAIALVLLISFRTPTSQGVALGAGSAIVGSGGGTVTTGQQGSGLTGAGGAGTDGSGTGSTGSTGTAGQSSGSQQAQTRTVTGPVVQTRFGPVQVSVSLDGNQITDVVALQLPNGDGRSSMISSRVEGMLRSQALQAQSANIDGVSGATYTSSAYQQSLQAALDSAGI